MLFRQEAGNGEIERTASLLIWPNPLFLLGYHDSG